MKTGHQVPYPCARHMSYRKQVHAVLHRIQFRLDLLPSLFFRYLSLNFFMNQADKLSLPPHPVRHHTNAPLKSRNSTFEESGIFRDTQNFEVRMLFEELSDIAFIFDFGKCAGRVNHHPAGSKHSDSSFKNFILQRCIISRTLLFPVPDHIRLSTEHSFPGTGTVD